MVLYLVVANKETFVIPPPNKKAGEFYTILLSQGHDGGKSGILFRALMHWNTTRVI